MRRGGLAIAAGGGLLLLAIGACSSDENAPNAPSPIDASAAADVFTASDAPLPNTFDGGGDLPIVTEASTACSPMVDKLRWSTPDLQGRQAFSP